MFGRASISVLALAVAATAAAAQAPDLGSEPQQEAGRRLYDKYCAQCHGVEGDGQGHATPRVKPEPRDFTSGKYKFRTTPSGKLPTDDDIRRAIREGLPYTSMPGWPQLTDEQVQNLIYYLKTFSDDFQDADSYAAPIDVPRPPDADEEAIARGREVYEAQGCAACHGELGRGDGPSGPTLRDDWGDHIRAADLTQRWTFRGGPTKRDIFRTFSTGVNGTPMPSYAETLAVEDRWDLVNYIYSLGESDEPDYDELVVVEHVEDELDLERADELFADAPPSRFPLFGQIVESGRDFYPPATSVVVQAVHNGREVAFRVRWHDMRAETSGSNSPTLPVPRWDEDNPGAAADEDDAGGDDFWGEAEADEGDAGGDDFWGEAEADEGADDFWGEAEPSGAAGAGDGSFSDAFAIQLPGRLPTGIRKPYFLFGDLQNPVDLWFVDLAEGDRPQQFVARGAASIEPIRADELQVGSGYDRGEWTVIWKRPLPSDANVTFAEERFVPIAFSVWDGFNRERGNKRSLTRWFYVWFEPAQEVSAMWPMARIALIVLVAELALVFWIRRTYSRRRAADRAGGGAVPEGGLAR